MSTTPKPADAPKPKPRKLSPAQLSARITRDSAELAKRAGAVKLKPKAKPKAAAAAKKK